MEFIDTTKLSPEQHVELLEKENADLKEAGRPADAPGEITSKQACEDIRAILQQLRSQKEMPNSGECCNITDIIFLRSDGTIDYIGAHKD